jgi:hypothetical protein
MISFNVNDELPTFNIANDRNDSFRATAANKKTLARQPHKLTPMDRTHLSKTTD